MTIKTEWLSLLSLAIGALAGGTLQAQNSQDELQKKYEAKVHESWYTSGGWIDDFGAAKERARKENKVVFAYFTRSYSP
ncbi:MAG: hypothetical protein H6832_03340 [Planctomycetes bacterium]|nr:hypothetical protein [Planctomycetota bacterium]